MTTIAEVPLDPAGVFAAAHSLWEACRNESLQNPSLDLSAAYNGWDQLMREVMRIGEQFESWACEHVDFDRFDEVWPYLLGDRFGSVCLDVFSATGLADFNEQDCLRIALRLKLPLRATSKLPIPMDSYAENPVQGAGFTAFRIQTVREANNEESVTPFTIVDDPYDEDFGPPFYGVYGICDNELEHIADRETLHQAIVLVQKLAPGIRF